MIGAAITRWDWRRKQAKGIELAPAFALAVPALAFAMPALALAVTVAASGHHDDGRGLSRLHNDDGPRWRRRRLHDDHRARRRRRRLHDDDGTRRWRLLYDDGSPCVGPVAFIQDPVPAFVGPA